MKYWWSSVVLLLVLLTVAPTSKNAQDVRAAPEKAEPARHQFALNLVRAANTAEAIDYMRLGSYSPWRTLLDNHREYFDQLISAHRLEPPGLSFGDLPEVLPEWNLRMNVHADGKGYDLLLRDMTDKKCGYAVVTDEHAVLRQSKTIDCEI